jgi:ppGpp synthetase/RelA/SpoT-type nucleotidyltranferase
MGLIEEFIARYRREFDYYDQTARLIAQALDSNLQAAGIRSMVTSRAKSPSRLEAKVRQRARTKTYTTLEDISADIVDLAGARVSLYFPGERDQVDRLVRQLFVLLEPPKEFPASSKPTYKKRFSGYWATHYRVQLKESSLGTAQQRYAETRVEIQVASVLMHAWSEVEHDLVYKPFEGTLSDEEYAILDELNGLVIAGEIALERLQKAGEARVAGSEREFENHFDLASHLLSRTALEAHGPLADSALGRVDLLFELLKRLNLLTPDQLKPYIDAVHHDTERRPIAEQIIDRLLAEDESRYKVYEEIRAARPLSTRAEEVVEPSAVELHEAIGHLLSEWARLERVIRDLRPSTDQRRVFLPIGKMMEQFVPDVREFERIRRMRNGLVHGMDTVDATDLHDAANRLHDIVDEVIRRSQQNPPAPE